MTSERIWLVPDRLSPSVSPYRWLSAFLARKVEYSVEAKQALEVDTHHIVRCFLERLADAPSRLVTGLIVGAVQSGKTGSMLAVSALALDHKFDIVIIISGTRVSLWRQTFDRAVQDLDGWNSILDFDRRQVREWIPNPALVQNEQFTPKVMFGVSVGRLSKILGEGNPIVAVVMKQADHLSALRESIHKAIRAARGPLKMLVIDDEADDGSILGYTSQSVSGDRLLPKCIEGLWTSGRRDNCVFHDTLRVAYLAYTATPQANLLQQDYNPLSPRDFVTCIRAPSRTGSPGFRDHPTFQVPSVLSRHIGGEDFYPPESEPLKFSVALDTVDSLSMVDWESRLMKDLGNALRSFLVATACRLLESKLSYLEARSVVASTRSEAKAATPPIASMLFNPSSRIESHFDGELYIRAWVHQLSPHAANTNRDVSFESRPPIEWERIKTRIESEEEEWSSWLLSFRRSADLIRARSGGAGIQLPPSDWEQVKRVIIDEVVPSIRTKVVNSSEGADPPPQFEPVLLPDGTWRLADAFCTVFIAGNVMSRGLTLEGLSTTLFLRDPNSPLADTQMQMQRWFGYRGAWLPYCRLFAYKDQIARFSEYHVADDALRTEIINIERTAGGTPCVGVSPQVLGSWNFLPTGKVQNIRRLALAPGGSPFINGFWDGAGEDPNLETIARHFAGGCVEGVSVAGTSRGLLLKRKYSLLEVADLLDEMQYVAHDPTPLAEIHQRWDSNERILEINQTQSRFFRPRMTGDLRNRISKDRFLPNRCPYSIAAYLRLWDACRERSAIGLYPIDKSIPWGHLSAAERARRCPKFSIGIRFGAGNVVSGTSIDRVGIDDLGREFAVRLMDRGFDSEMHELTATWGSRNSGVVEESYMGDQSFDFHRNNLRKLPSSNGSPWRAIDEDGLVLFHVIKGPNDFPRLAIGICLTDGGPDQICNLRPAQRQ